MEERAIGATELRQKLTDVIQTIKEQKVAYVVETFGRPQVIVMDLCEYRRLQAAQPPPPQKHRNWRGRHSACGGNERTLMRVG